MKLSDIDLTTEEVSALRYWLAELTRHRAHQAAMRDEEAAEQAEAEALAEKIVTIARACAEEHGVVAGLMAEHQATAAYASWFDGAGYYDIDEHFSPDDSDQELWETAYANRLAELRRAA